MKPEAFYNIIYSVMSSHTPINGDCGLLCEKNCCRGDKDGDGMYLFPYEELLYRPLPEWACISDTDFEYDKNQFALLFSCDGICDRNMRPLSCRIFPLTPYITKDGKLTVIVDPRAKGMCPLSPLYVSDFDKDYVNAVRVVGKLLVKNTQCKKFLTSFSRMIDDVEFL